MLLGKSVARNDEAVQLQGRKNASACRSANPCQSNIIDDDNVHTPRQDSISALIQSIRAVVALQYGVLLGPRMITRGTFASDARRLSARIIVITTLRGVAPDTKRPRTERYRQ